MPLYEYECRKCHHRFEVIQKVSDRPVRKCPKCGKTGVEKLLSAPAVHFKGTGWYVTDYAGKGRGKAGGEGKGHKDDAAGTKDSGTKESPTKDGAGGKQGKD
jgi:putative FmdB family regulatory protein